MLFLDIFDKISFGIISGIFMMVAKVYDLLLKIVHRTYTMDGTYFEQFATTVYVLAGVFMLFRTVIGLVQMLINPDQMNDKQAGAGKMITRIITSIIMLMAFAPNGILFGQSGLFARMEEALLASDGLVTQFMNLSEQTSNNKIENEKENDFLIENVEAASKTKTLKCYYIDKKAQVLTNPSSTSGTGHRQYYYNLGYPIKIEFYSDSTTGKTGHINCNNGKCKYSYTVFSTQRVNGDDNLGYYGSIDKAITKGNFFNKDTFPSTCPKAFKEVDGHLAAQKNFIEHGNSLADCGKNSGVNATIDTQCWNSAKEKMEDCRKTGLSCKNIGIQGGYTSYKELKKAVSGLKLTLSGASASVASPSKFVQKNTNTGKNDDTAPLKRYLDGVDSDAVVFAQGTASSLQECTTEKKEECAEAQHGKNNNGTDGMFKDTESNSTIVKLMDAKDLDVGFIISVLTGIALIVYLLYLCIEVLVRKLKLYFLEMLAPLPIVCYINPKDKIFNQWLKMYITTYADLFIKLISIGIAVNLLAATFEDFWSSGGWLIKFFYIVAILAFAKLVPTMISKIFGLDSMGGSFKEISGMAKAAAGFGTGAVIGGAVGTVTGGFGGMLRGIGRGAGAGFKGDFTGNASGIADYNRNLKFSKAAGSTAGGRLLTRLGINDYAAQKRKNDIEKANLAESKAKALEAIQRRRTANDNTLSNIAGFEKRVEGQFDKHKYDGKGIQEVEAYRAADAELSAARASGNAARIEAAENAASAARGSALDAVKQYEIGRGANGDSEAQAYLATLDQSVVKKGFKDGIDAQKKSITADNVSIKNDISQLDISYTAKEQALAAKERALENSASKANFDAVKDLDKK